jgi:chitin-binding protein
LEKEETMSPYKRAFRIALTVVLVATLIGLFPKQAFAHGAMGNPPGRVYVCYLEGPESPDSAACQAAVATGGTQALYDWNGIRQGNANGNHQAIIPDGRLCSAFDNEFIGMDLARSDWPATTLPTSGNFTWSFRVTAQHMGYMNLYVTRNGYDPNQPLKWSDLEGPFSTYATNTTNGASGNYTWTSAVPTGKSGRHMIYMIWQRTDSPEAFYSCSDVIFGSAGPTNTPSRTATVGGPTVTLTRTPTRTNTPSGPINTSTRTATPSGPTATLTRTPTVGGVAAWAPNIPYAVNAQVSYGGHTYKCLQAHTSLTGWEPPNVPALWQLIN